MTEARILIVDDTPVNVRLLADLLSINGFAALTAGSGRDGFARAAAD